MSARFIGADRDQVFLINNDVEPAGPTGGQREEIRDPVAHGRRGKPPPRSGDRGRREVEGLDGAAAAREFLCVVAQPAGHDQRRRAACGTVGRRAT
jgi:hypothetical protein